MITVLTKKGACRVLQTHGKYGKMLTVRNGWLSCPFCGKNGRMMKVRPDAEGERVTAYCRVCKKEILIDIHKGACFESQGQ